MSYSRLIHDPRLKGIPELSFNNTYDVDFVEKQTREVKDLLYTRCLHVQEELCGINIIGGKMNEFKTDDYLARIFDMPRSTYFTRIQNKFLHFFEEKDALYSMSLKEDPITYPKGSDLKNNYPFSPYYAPILPKQGIIYKKYTLYDVCKNSTLFKRRLLFFIREDNTSLKSSIFMNLIIIPTKTSTYLAIETTGENRMNKSYLESLISKKMDWFIYETKAGNYWLSNSYRKEDITIINDYGYIDFIFDDITSANKLNGYNAFLVAIPTTNENLWSITYSIYDADNRGFKVPKKYIENFKDGSKLLILNEVQLGYSITILAKSNSLGKVNSPTGIFQIPLKENPIPPKNILAFLIDTETEALYPLPQSEITMWYPNVYKINSEEILTDTNIKIFAYYAKDASTSFTNPIKNYMEYKSDEYITQCIENSLPYPIANYVPYPDNYSIEDYKKDSLSKIDKPYQYILNKDIWMLLDDPNRYNELFKNVYSKISSHNDHIYEILVSNTKIKERSVLNNHEQIVNTAKHVTFSKAMSYITINTKEQEGYPFYLYIDGIRILPKYVFVEGFVQYVYFPNDMLSDESVITIEIISINSSYTDKGSILFKSKDEYLPFPESFEHFSDQNLLYYDNETKKIIPNTDFNYSIFIDIEKDHILTSDNEYLKTSNDEFVITGSHIKLATNNSGFYKNIGTRISKQNIDLTGTGIYEKTYRDNSEIITNPANQKSWNEDMICFNIEAMDVVYPITLVIDGTMIPNEDVYRYLKIDTTSNINNEYIFIPQKYCTSTSKIIITTLIAKKWEFLKNKVSFDTTAEICISTSNDDNLNKTINIQSTDFYKWYGDISEFYNESDRKYHIPDFIGDPKKDRFRLWKTESDFGLSLVYDTEYDFSFNINYNNEIILELNNNIEGTLYLEYLPSRYTICARFNDILPNPENVINFFDILERPLDITYYDIFADGIRLDSNKLKTFSPTFAHLSDDLNTTMHFIVTEKSHDSDVYGNRYRKMTLEEQLMVIDPDFKEYMKTK